MIVAKPNVGIVSLFLTAVFTVWNAPDAWASTKALARKDATTGARVLRLVDSTPSEARRIKDVFGSAGPTISLKQTKDGFEVTGQLSEQLASVITLMSKTNEDFQNKVLELENQNKTLHESNLLQQSKTTELYKFLQASSIGLGICLIAFVGIVRNQFTKMKINLRSLETSIESRKQ